VRCYPGTTRKPPTFTAILAYSAAENRAVEEVMATQSTNFSPKLIALILFTAILVHAAAKNRAVEEVMATQSTNFSPKLVALVYSLQS
jgi:hypothetical protein